MGLLAFAMALLVLVSFSIYAATADEESRYAPLDDNAYMDDATYVGSDICEDCHFDQYEEWADSLHPKKIQVADDDTIVAPWDIDVTITVADGVEATVSLTKNATGYWVSLDDSGNHTYRVDFVLGGFGWKQRFVTQIGNSKYILPHQYNVAPETWVPFHPEDWYDTTTGEPKMVAMSQSWDRRCAGCHATGVELEFNDTSGEWMASYSELGIGCEGCHGPGSLHLSPPDGEDQEDYTWNPMDSAVCGNCHNRGNGIGEVGGKTTGYPLNAAGETIMPGDHLDDFFVMAPGYHGDGETSKKHRQQYPDYITSEHSHSLITIKDHDHGGDSCLQCHSTDYRLAEEDDKPTLAEAQNAIECSACHLPHGSDIDHDLRVPQDEICTQCHSSGGAVPGERVHHPQKEMIEGTIPITGLSGDPWMDGEATCTNCHMPFTAKTAVNYDIASHSFKFISPATTIEFGTPNSCTYSCHGDDTPGDTYTDEEAVAFIEEWETETTALLAIANANVTAAEAALNGAMDLGFSVAAFDAANDTFNMAALAAAYVESDGTMVHNHEWAEELLDYAIENADAVMADLTPGTVTGIVKDGDGKAVSGAEIKSGDTVWATTGADGSFSFDIAPGDHDFEVQEDGKKKKDFTATGVVAGETTDVETIKYKKEDDSPGFGLLIAVLAMAFIALWTVSDRRR
jgi:predicted CXXCH cytochrome family protein